MKILVAIKQVPSRDGQLKTAADGRWIDESGLTFEINEPDAYALEEALQLREKLGGEVIVLCAGPERATASIREALAKGADRAVHAVEDNLESADGFHLGRLLAKAIAAESPDLVLTGLQSDDFGHGQTGVVVAELLGLPHATIIMQVEAGEGSIRVKRELEDGWFQYLTLPLPAVLTIQSGINKLRYATLMGIKKARAKEIRTTNASELGVSLAAEATIERVYAPSRSKQTVMLEGSPAEQAAQLVEKLQREVRVL
ncbi:MAG: electron transfer flavoprotein subunit beta/FixA family protein [Bryobacterales bacterium]|nr:electron transfer flavoprotein subunit beta/FixA family protein [Bryobacterales bacterium]